MDRPIEDLDDIEELEKEEEFLTPFSDETIDTSKIDIATELRSLDSLIQMMRFDEIDMNTEFQRHPNLWKSATMSRLIESILVGLPLPAFFFDIADDNKWLIVDGLQRLSSIYKFVLEDEKPLIRENPRPPLVLRELEFLKDLEGKTYKELDRRYQRKITDYQITCFLIKRGTPADIKYSIFRRINTGGLRLSNQEIRNALADPRDRTFLRTLAKSDKMKLLMGDLSKRMRDQELVLRFWAFYKFDYLAETNKKQLALFLDKAMEELAKSDETYRQEFELTFKTALQRCFVLLGEHAFHKTDSARKNASLFETWTVQLAKLSSENFNILLSRKIQVAKKTRELFEDENFLRSITSATATEKNVSLRHKRIKKLIEGVIND